jgi:hypothetical protein
MLTPAQAEERLRKIAIPASFPQVGRQPRLQPPSGSYPISGSGWKIPYVPTMRSAPQDRAPSAQLPPIGMFSTGSGAVSVHHTLPAPATIGGQAPQCMSPEASSANYPGKRIAHIPTMGGANPNHTIPNSLPSPPPLQGSYKRRADYNGAETPSNPGFIALGGEKFRNRQSTGWRGVVECRPIVVRPGFSDRGVISCTSSIV